MKSIFLKRAKSFLFILLTAALLPSLSFASSSVGNAANDTVITGKVKSSLAVNQVTHALNIGVETNDGVVTLKGVAETSLEAAKAVEIAESTAGVRAVNTSQLTIKNSNQPMTDTYLTAKIKGVFVKNNLTPGQINVPIVNVKVETQQGVAYLSGSVENGAQRTKLISLARSVDGVKEVKADIQVKN